MKASYFRIGIRDSRRNILVPYLASHGTRSQDSNSSLWLKRKRFQPAVILFIHDIRTHDIPPRSKFPLTVGSVNVFPGRNGKDWAILERALSSLYDCYFKTYVTIETARDANVNSDLHYCTASPLADKGQRLEVQCIAALHFFIGLVVCAILRLPSYVK